ncbi:MAG: hypothetical protein K6A37_02580 [Saccharofermentans sp.]|nr:hypothetical protein [Saccharofermentans sp.]
MFKSKVVAAVLSAAVAFSILPGFVSLADDTINIEVTVDTDFIRTVFEGTESCTYEESEINDAISVSPTYSVGITEVTYAYYNISAGMDNDMYALHVCYGSFGNTLFEAGTSLNITVNGIPLAYHDSGYDYVHCYYGPDNGCNVYVNSVNGETNNGFELIFTDAFANYVDMYRLYNPNSGEHFYTADAGERDFLINAGWDYEGIGWRAPVSSDRPVYRLYNPNAGEHHYTLSSGERDYLVSLGWNDEGIGWYSDESRRVPLYRQYNPNEFANNHNYTTSLGESDYLVSIGWQFEGVGWYGIGSGQE